MNGQAGAHLRAEGPVTVLRSIDDVRSAVRDIAPDILSRCEQTEAQRIVAAESIDAMRAKGLFGVVGAREFGGSEVGVEALVQATIDISRVCGSTGWVYGVLAGHSWMLNLFPVEAQREMAEQPGALIATVFRLGGEARKVDGGYSIEGGYGRFCSGVDHASWIIVGATVAADDGPPDPRFMLVPRADVEVIDDWQTLGMRGTGSRSIEIKKSFVPAHRSVSLKDLIAGCSPGAQHHGGVLYRLGFGDVTPFSIVGAPLGMALGALDCFVEDMRKARSDKGDEPVPYQDAQFLRLAKASADIEAAVKVVLGDARLVDGLEDIAEFDELARRSLPRNWGWAVQSCRDAVNQLYEASGGSAIYNSSRFQRIWRDINSSAQHFGFTEDKAMIDYARALIGLKPEQFVIQKAKRNEAAATS